MRKREPVDSEEQLRRLRAICLGFPGVTEKLSHGEPTFFGRKKVFAMFANNHHGDGHVAVWIPAAEGVQGELIASDPETYFRPPYVGVRGWVGIELHRVGNEELAMHLAEARRIAEPEKKRRSPGEGASRRGRS